MIEWIQRTWQSFAESFVKNFIVEDRYMLIVRGLGTTILISLLAVLLGCIIGFIMAFFRLSKIKVLNWIAGIYIDVIRGTPTVVQLLIIYYVIFAPFKNMPKVVIAGPGTDGGGAFAGTHIGSDHAADHYPAGD